MCHQTVVDHPRRDSRVRTQPLDGRSMNQILPLILGGVFTALGFLIPLFAIGIRRVLRFSIWVDISFSAVLVLIFYGSFAGMITAMSAGITLSTVLHLLHKLIGHEKLTLTRRGWRWRRVPGYLR